MDKRNAKNEWAKKGPFIESLQKTVHLKLGSIHTAKEAEEYLLEITEKAQKDTEGELVDSELAEAGAFIDFLIDKQKVFGNESTAKMCLLLKQDKAANIENLVSLYGSILWTDTPSGVKAMSDAKRDLMPENKNTAFYEELYSLGVYVPYDNTDLSNAERAKKAKPLKDRLKALRNSSNADFIDYLLSDEKLEHWTY